MERGVMVKHGEDQRGGEICIDSGPAVYDVFDAQPPGEHDERPPSLVDQHIAGIEDAINLVSTGSLRPNAKYPTPSTPELGKGPSQLRLVDNTDENRSRNRNILEKPEQHLQFEDIAQGIRRKKGDKYPYDLLRLGLGYRFVEPIEKPGKHAYFKNRTNKRKEILQGISPHSMTPVLRYRQKSN